MQRAGAVGAVNPHISPFPMTNEALGKSVDSLDVGGIQCEMSSCRDELKFVSFIRNHNFTTRRPFKHRLISCFPFFTDPGSRKARQGVGRDSRQGGKLPFPKRLGNRVKRDGHKGCESCRGDCKA